MSLKQRLERLEADTKPRELKSSIQGFVARSRSGCRMPGSLRADDPRLKQGVNDEGEAVISRWWSVLFFEGTKEQQNARLNELRLCPEFQKPWNAGDIPLRYEGGASWDNLVIFNYNTKRKISEKGGLENSTRRIGIARI